MKSRDIPSLIIISIFLIFFLPFVSSVPPTSTVILDRGVDIVHPETQLLQYGKDLEINFWTYNSSNGLTLTNSSLNCTVYIIDDEGINYFRFSNQAGANALITYGKGSPLCVNCWTMTLPKENLSIGIYSYKIKCQGTNEGGYFTGFFEVTQNGEDLTTAKAVLYSMLSLVIFLIFVISLYFSVSLNYKNNRNEKGQVTKIEYGKYFKVGLILISYSLFLWFLNILVAVSDNFVNLDIFYGLISGLYLVLLRAFFPVFVIIIIWIIVLAIKDINFKSLMREFNFK